MDQSYCSTLSNKFSFYSCKLCEDKTVYFENYYNGIFHIQNCHSSNQLIQNNSDKNNKKLDDHLELVNFEQFSIRITRMKEISSSTILNNNTATSKILPSSENEPVQIILDELGASEIEALVYDLQLDKHKMTPARGNITKRSDTHLSGKPKSGLVQVKRKDKDANQPITDVVIKKMNSIIHRRRPAQSPPPTKKDNNGYPCLRCSQQFKTINQLMAHTTIEKQRRVLYREDLLCTLCEKQFKLELSYVHHMELHENAGVDVTYTDAYKIHKDREKSKRKRWPKTYIKYYLCMICNKNFTDKKEYLSHVKTEHLKENGKYSCQVHCSEEFKNITDVMKHIRISSPQKGRQKWKRRFLSNWKKNCKSCGKTFKYEAVYKKHIKTHESLLNPADKKYVCPNRLFRTPKSGLVKVTKSKDTNITEVAVEKMNSLNNHPAEHEYEWMKSHRRKRAGPPAKNNYNPPTGYPCLRCSQQFKTINQLRAHTCHDEKTTLVPVDKSSVLYRADLLCTLCKKQFKFVLSYTRHMELHEKEGVEVTYTDEYEIHKERTKSGRNRPWATSSIPFYLCRICNKNFTDKKEYSSHVKTEHCKENGKYSCQVHCSEEFSTIKKVMHHIRICTDKKAIKSWKKPKKRLLSKWKCGKTFKNPTIYKNHMLKTHGSSLNYSQEKKFPCPICSKLFITPASMRSHFVIHLENNPFICKFSECGAKFCKWSSLQRHINLHSSIRKLWICDTCGVELVQETSLRLHKKRCHSGAAQPVRKRKQLRVKPIGELAPSTFFLQQCKIKKEQQDDEELRFELESEHIVDNIILSEDESSEMSEAFADKLTYGTAAAEENRVHVSENGFENVKSDKDARILLNSIIPNDPVYLQLLKDNPIGAASILSGL